MSRFPRLRVLTLLAAACAAGTRAHGEDRFVLASGPDEVLHGSFESFSKESVVIRRHDALEPLAFRPEAVVAVEFDRAATPAGAAGMAMVRFNNGDALPGKVVSYTAEKTVLETSAGRLEMASGFVRSLDFASGGGFGTDLIGKESDWKSEGPNFGGRNREAFQIKQGKLTIGGYGWRTRTAEFPESCVLVVEIGAGEQFMCAFGQDRPQFGQGKGYLLRVQGGRAMLMRQADGNQELVVNVALPPSRDPAARRRLSLAMDGAAKTAVLTVDGRVAGRATVAVPAPKGKYMMIGGSGGKITLSRLAVIPCAPGGGLAKAPAEDALVLANRDQAKGKLVSIEGGSAVFESEAGKLSIPLARLAGVVFSGKNNKMPSGEGARVLFGDLDGLTLRLDKVEDGRIKAQSAIFGPCEIGLDRVSRIEFQPAKAKPPEIKEGEPDTGGEGDEGDEGEVFHVRPAIRLRGRVIQGGQVFEGGGVIIE